jgi:hypothetical protein
MLAQRFSIDPTLARQLRKALGNGKFAALRVGELAKTAGYDLRTVIRRLKSAELSVALRELGVCLGLPTSLNEISGRSLIRLSIPQA